ncbi:MAG: hypothetical protein ABIO41_01595 [Ignavibacteria bacterium]
MKYIYLVIVIFCFLKVQAQSDSIVEKEISADEYRFFMTNNNHSFFSGSLQIVDKYNNTVFYADSFYTRYNWDTLIDLNGDGNKDFILDVGTGATMYDYNMFLIFDFKKSSESLFEIHNAELITGVDKIPKITSYERLSPAVMGAGYVYSLKYENDKIVLETDMMNSNVLKSFDTDEEEDLYLIKEYGKEFDECEEDSQVLIYYQAYLIQQKILCEEKRGWKFFDKHYKCKNKKKVKAGLKKIVDESYSYIADPNNYKFALNKY